MGRNRLRPIFGQVAKMEKTEDDLPMIGDLTLTPVSADEDEVGSGLYGYCKVCESFLVEDDAEAGCCEDCQEEDFGSRLLLLSPAPDVLPVIEALTLSPAPDETHWSFTFSIKDIKTTRDFGFMLYGDENQEWRNYSDTSEAEKVFLIARIMGIDLLGVFTEVNILNDFGYKLLAKVDLLLDADGSWNAPNGYHKNYHRKDINDRDDIPVFTVGQLLAKFNASIETVKEVQEEEAAKPVPNLLVPTEFIVTGKTILRGVFDQLNNGGESDQATAEALINAMPVLVASSFFREQYIKVSDVPNHTQDVEKPKPEESPSAKKNKQVENLLKYQDKVNC